MGQEGEGGQTTAPWNPSEARAATPPPQAAEGEGITGQEGARTGDRRPHVPLSLARGEVEVEEDQLHL